MNSAYLTFEKESSFPNLIYYSFLKTINWAKNKITILIQLFRPEFVFEFIGEYSNNSTLPLVIISKKNIHFDLNNGIPKVKVYPFQDFQIG